MARSVAVYAGSILLTAAPAGEDAVEIARCSPEGLCHSASMRDADALVAEISASSDDDFPVRVGMTAEQLGRVARAHFDAKPALLRLCQTLRSNQETGACNEEARAFDGQDAKVIAYFLRRNTALSALQCVRWGMVLQRCPALLRRLGSNHFFPRSLQASKFRDEGTAALGEALKVNSTLAFLECVASGEAGCRGGTWPLSEPDG